MKQTTLDNFMSEYKRLCDDFGMSFQFNIYDELGVHDDVNQEDVDCRLNLESFTATLNPPYVPVPKMLGPMTKDQWFMHKVQAELKASYMPLIVERLNSSPMLDIAGAHEVTRGIDPVQLSYWKHTDLKITPHDPADTDKAEAAMKYMGYLKGKIVAEVIPPMPLPLQGDISIGRVERMTKEEIEKKYPRKHE